MPDRYASLSPPLQGSSKALSTVTAIIDGTGSVGAAIGPLLASEIPYDYIFYTLMLANVCAIVVRRTKNWRR